MKGNNFRIDWNSSNAKWSTTLHSPCLLCPFGPILHNSHFFRLCLLVHDCYQMDTNGNKCSCIHAQTYGATQNNPACLLISNSRIWHSSPYMETCSNTLAIAAQHTVIRLSWLLLAPDVPYEWQRVNETVHLLSGLVSLHIGWRQGDEVMKPARDCPPRNGSITACSWDLLFFPSLFTPWKLSSKKAGHPPKCACLVFFVAVDLAQ